MNVFDYHVRAGRVIEDSEECKAFVLFVVFFLIGGEFGEGERFMGDRGGGFWRRSGRIGSRCLSRGRG